VFANSLLRAWIGWCSVG